MPLKSLVDVRRRPTVVRLEHLDGNDAEWITESYFITRDVENHLSSIREVLGREAGTGMFLIGQYGSGKSHFLAYVIDRLRNSEFVPDGPVPHAISLLNFRAELTLESILCKELNIAQDEQDRRDQWSLAAKRYPNGLVLLIGRTLRILEVQTERASL